MAVLAGMDLNLSHAGTLRVPGMGVNTRSSSTTASHGSRSSVWRSRTFGHPRHGKRRRTAALQNLAATGGALPSAIVEGYYPLSAFRILRGDCRKSSTRQTTTVESPSFR